MHPADFADLDVPEETLAERARRVEDARKRTSLPAHDVDAPELLRWRDIPKEARAAAGAAAIFGAMKLSELSTDMVRYDDRQRVVFVVKPDPYVRNGPRRVAATAVPPTVEASVARVRAAFGHAATELLRFVNRKK